MLACSASLLTRRLGEQILVNSATLHGLTELGGSLASPFPAANHTGLFRCQFFTLPPSPGHLQWLGCGLWGLFVSCICAPMSRFFIFPFCFQNPSPNLILLVVLQVTAEHASAVHALARDQVTQLHRRLVIDRDGDSRSLHGAASVAFSTATPDSDGSVAATETASLQTDDGAADDDESAMAALGDALVLLAATTDNPHHVLVGAAKTNSAFLRFFLLLLIFFFNKQFACTGARH
jgi:hypothetical protein